MLRDRHWQQITGFRSPKASILCFQITFIRSVYFNIYYHRQSRTLVIYVSKWQWLRRISLPLQKKLISYNLIYIRKQKKKTFTKTYSMHSIISGIFSLVTKVINKLVQIISFSCIKKSMKEIRKSILSAFLLNQEYYKESWYKVLD